LVPLIFSRPWLSFACVDLAFVIGALVGGAAFPCPATIPAAPAMTAATATAEATSRTARRPLSRVRFFICVRLLSSEPRGAARDWLVLRWWGRRTRVRTVATPLSFCARPRQR